MARDNTPTERRGYQRPPIGDDWAGAWDDLVEDSDELAIERGPIADRPSTGAYDDALYLAVDQRTLWRWDAAASDWEAVSGLGTASDPVPGTSHFESVSTGDLQTFSDPSDVTASRSYGTTYTNTTASDIVINVEAQASVDGTRVGQEVFINGERADRQNIEVSRNDRVSVMAVVPGGADYSVEAFSDTSDFSLVRWVEQS